MSFELLPKQENATFYLRNDYTEEILYGGAAGGGKSALGCLWLISNCQNFPGTRWVMGRAVLKTLKETTLKTFNQIASKLDITSQFNYNKQDGVVYWNNGSEILLKDLEFKPSDEEFDSLGSLEITGAFIDEVAQIHIKAWTVLKSRCRYMLDAYTIHGEKTETLKVLERNLITGEPTVWLSEVTGKPSKGLTPKMLGTCNPTKNWAFKYFYKAKKQKSIAPYRAFVQALPTDNPFLPEIYIKILRQLPEASKRRLLDGDWEYDDDKATLIPYGAILDYWNGRHVDREGEMYLTIDVARKGKDKSVFRVWHGWVCIKRYSMAISKVNEVVDKAREIQTEFKITNSNTIADEDGVGGGVVDYLGCRGFVNNSKALPEPESTTGDKSNYDNLKSQCSMKMAKKISDKEIVEMCEDLQVIEETTEEMGQVKQKDIDKDGKMAVVSKAVVKEQIGRSPDEWDSIMMRYWFVLSPPVWAC